MRRTRAVCLALAAVLLLSACATATPTPSPTPTSAPPVVYLEKLVTLDRPDFFVNTVVFSPDSRTLYTGDLNGEILRWASATWTSTVLVAARSTHAADIAANIAYFGTLALSPDGSLLATAFGEQGEVTGLDPDAHPRFGFSYGERAYGVEISPDGDYLAVAGLKAEVLLFDLSIGQPAARLTNGRGSIITLAFSPDSRTLLAAYREPEKVLVLWDVATRQELKTLDLTLPPNNAHHDAVFSPDGSLLAVASTEVAEVKLVDVAGGRVVRELREHTKASYQLAFSPDGTRLASVGDDGTLRLWEVTTGVLLQTVRVPRQELIAVAFSPDGTLLAFSVWGQGVQVWTVKR